MAKIYFHKEDNDGRVGAYWANELLKKFDIEQEDIQFVGRSADMNTPVDINAISDNEFIVITDCSFTPATMKDVLAKTNNVVWVDHHISAMKAYEEYEEGFIETIPGIRCNGIAACILTAYLAKNPHLVFDEPADLLRCIKAEETGKAYQPVFEKDVPVGTIHFGRYDVWDFSDPDTLPFVTGAGKIYVSTELGRKDMYNIVDDSDAFNVMYDVCLSRGDTLLEEQASRFASVISTSAFECSLIHDDPAISSLRCIAVNHPPTSSILFDSVSEDYDVFVRYNITKEGSYCYTFSTRREDIDISEIAKAFCGGGHRKVGGATLFKYICKYERAYRV